MAPPTVRRTAVRGSTKSTSETRKSARIRRKEPLAPEPPIAPTQSETTFIYTPKPPSFDPPSQNQEEEASSSGCDNIPYPNDASESDPINENASQTDKDNHVQRLRQYSLEMYQAYQRMEMRGEVMWFDFITAFRPHKIHTWSRPEMYERCYLLKQRNLHVEVGRSISTKNALIDVLHRRKHIPSNNKSEASVHHQSEVRNPGPKHPLNTPRTTSRKHDEVKYSRISSAALTTDKRVVKTKPTHTIPARQMTQKREKTTITIKAKKTRPKIPTIVQRTPLKPVMTEKTGSPSE